MVLVKPRPLWRWTCALAVGLSLALARGDAARAVTEHELKAAFLYNFVKFVHWPSGAFRPDDGELTLCTLGDPFRGVLEPTVAGKTAQEKRLIVRHLDDPSEARDCHVLFVDASRAAQLGLILEQVRELPGEVDQFALRGGIIGIFVADNRVRFEVNAGAADRAGLQISSQLLSLATSVIAGEAP
jgi:hypothetical protein